MRLWGKIVTSSVAAGGFALDAASVTQYGRLPWSWFALVGFLGFTVLTFWEIRTLSARPRLRLVTQGDGLNRTVIIDGRKCWVRVIAVEASAHVVNCTVRVNRLVNPKVLMHGFVPTALRWYGADGAGSERRSFTGTEYALLVIRLANVNEPHWELQAPVRHNIGAQFKYPPGEYEIELRVSSDNSAFEDKFVGRMTVGDATDENVVICPERQPWWQRSGASR